MPYAESDEALIANALHMWANYVETRTVTLSAKDAQQAHKPFQALDQHQMKLVLRLRALAQKYENQSVSTLGGDESVGSD